MTLPDVPDVSFFKTLDEAPIEQRIALLQKWWRETSAKIGDHAAGLHYFLSHFYHANQSCGGSRQLVISLHGIRSRGVWQKELGGELSAAGFIHEAIDYGYLMAIGLLIPGFRRKYLPWFNEKYNEIVTRHQIDRPSVIAHSFGTYIVVYSMQKFQLRFDRMILCGCIVKRNFNWPRFESLVNQVLNDYGGKDYWAWINEFVVWQGGSAGVYGFSVPWKGRLIQQENPDFEHSDYFYRRRYREVWIHFLLGFNPPENAYSPLGSNWKFIIGTPAILGAIGLGTYFWGRYLASSVLGILQWLISQGQSLVGS